MRERTTKSGKTTYQVLFRNGTRQSSRSFDSKAGAEKFEKLIDALGVARALAELDAPETSVTFGELAEAYFDFKKHRVRSERTIHDYRRDYSNWISARFGNLAAETITDQEVQAWVDSMIGKLEPKTIAGHHALLGAIFKWATSPGRRHLPEGTNPTAHTELPVRIKRPPKGVRLHAWHALYAALKTIGASKGCGNDAADLAHFLIASGWRISEAIALDESGCEDDGRHVTCYVLQVERRQADGTKRIVEDSKSRAGGRRVKLDPDASAMLRERLRSVDRGGLVLTRAGKKWNRETFDQGYWLPAAKAVGIKKPTIHELRHTAVGVFHASGADLAEIQRRIGHESILTTIGVYGGMIDDMKDDALDKTAALLRGDVAVKPAVEVVEIEQ